MNQMFPNLYNLLIPPNVTEHFRVSTHAVCLSCLWSESSGNLKEAPLISGPKPICFQFTGADDEKHESRASIKIELISALFNRLPYVGINNDKKFSVDALFFIPPRLMRKAFFPAQVPSSAYAIYVAFIPSKDSSSYLISSLRLISFLDNVSRGRNPSEVVSPNRPTLIIGHLVWMLHCKINKACFHKIIP